MKTWKYPYYSHPYPHSKSSPSPAIQHHRRLEYAVIVTDFVAPLSLVNRIPRPIGIQCHRRSESNVIVDRNPLAYEIPTNPRRSRSCDGWNHIEIANLMRPYFRTEITRSRFRDLTGAPWATTDSNDQLLRDRRPCLSLSLSSSLVATWLDLGFCFYF